MQWIGCGKWEALLWDYASGRLSGGDAAPMEAHLTRCAACRQRLETVRVTVAGVSELRESKPPASMANWQDLCDRLEQRNQAPAQSPVRLQNSAGVTWALGAAIALIGLFIWKHSIAISHRGDPLSPAKSELARTQKTPANRNSAINTGSARIVRTNSAVSKIGVATTANNLSPTRAVADRSPYGSQSGGTSSPFAQRRARYGARYRSPWHVLRFAERQKHRGFLRKRLLPVAGDTSKLADNTEIIVVKPTRDMVISPIPNQDSPHTTRQFVLGTIPLTTGATSQGDVQLASEEKQIW